MLYLEKDINSKRGLNMKIEKTFYLKTYDEANLITEAFGIESGYQKTVFALDIPDILPQITYISGESGCGKSIMLKEIIKKYNIVRAHVNIDKEKPLFLWGENKEENLKLLSLVGLGDATLFIAKWEELSDSQQYRAMLFAHLISDNKYIILDEFLSTLDRITARAVSYVFQKAIRKTNKILICATAHSDLIDFLQPNLYLEGTAFVHEWEIKEYNDFDNPYIDEIKIQHEDKMWYRNATLGELHYKGKYTGGVKDYLSLYYHDKLVGLLIGIYRMHDGGRRISRLVIHPSFRGCGFGVHLVKYYKELNPTVDVVASMARFNPVFEKAGLKRMNDVNIKADSKLKKELIKNGFDISKWFKKSYCNDFMKRDNNRRIFFNHISKISYLVCPGGKYLSDNEVKGKIMENRKLAGRVLWNIRPKILAKFG